MSHIAWTSIDLFHNVRRTFMVVTDIEGPHTVTYRAKLKLHGINTGIQVTPEGILECQTRERLIVPGDDKCGFARWVESHREAWLTALMPGTVVFGEWCGPGVEKGMEMMTRTIDFAKKTATVTFDADKTNATALAKATTDAGFPSTVRK